MKKVILVMFVLLLSALWVVAQSDSSAQTSSSPASSAQSQSSPSGASATAQSGNASSSAQTGMTSSNTIQGCLGGSDGAYTLTDSASGKTYNLSGSNDDLKAHVGQTVEIQGSQAAASNVPSTSESGATNDRSSSGAPAGTAPSSGTQSSDSSNAGVSAAGSQSFAVTSVRKISDSCSTK